MRQRRHVRLPPDLTSLFDVLFIVIFACLIRAAGAEHAVAETMAPPPPRKPPVPLAPLDPASLHARALGQLDRELAAKTAVVVRIAAGGTISALETGGKAEKLDVPLLEHEPDPDVEVAYLGDRSSALTVCGVVAVHLGAADGDLRSYLVIIAPELGLDDLPHALYEGLFRDVERCQADHHGLAVIVDPTVKPPSQEQR